MNDFVAYLNSFSSASGDTTGSLAEKQVCSAYYSKVKVDRKLGIRIADCVRENKHEAFILTGHAGDGKTSILVQVLRDLGLLQEQESLAVEKEYPNFYYVKDMSEISEDRQLEVLERALSAPQNGKSSLLISNTGPLLSAFQRLVEKRHANLDSEGRSKFQSQVLQWMDTSEDQERELEGYRFRVVNIARIDNVVFAGRILERILDKELWTPCCSCEKADVCPIWNNVQTVTAYFERVMLFVEGFYRYLYAYDHRLTIRQIISHITYALTAGLTCKVVLGNKLVEPFFNFHFANRFFGYEGISLKREAGQIEGIVQLRLMNLDSQTLKQDYDLFVKQDYNCFPEQLSDLLGQAFRKRKKYYRGPEDETPDTRRNEVDFRKAVRRFWYLFGKESRENVLDQAFGEGFTLYQNVVTGKNVPDSARKKIQDRLFQAMYIKNVGVKPQKKEPLPLTLRRGGNQSQSVLLILGSVQKGKLKVETPDCRSAFEDMDVHRRIVLNLGSRASEQFEITLPMLHYFADQINGSVEWSYSPALTHGIARLEALLLAEFREEGAQEGELHVLVRTTDSVLEETYTISQNGGRLSLE